MVSYAVTPEVLQKFKEPFGKLLEGSFSETILKLKVLIQKEQPTAIIAVGDTVTKNLYENQIKADLSITDNLTLRKQVPAQVIEGAKVVHIKNPQGLITPAAIKAIQQALQKHRPVHIQIEGEEDLLTLTAVMYAPENALVLYGQPNRGLVAVKVTPEKRAEAQDIWSKMKKVED